MTPRFVVPAASRRLATIATALAVAASLALPAQPVAADTDSVTVQKSTNATTTRSPGDAYTYTIRATTSAAVQHLIVADGAFDYPQIAVTGVSYTVNGVGPKQCGTPRPDNIRCVVGDVPAGTTVIATVNVRVNPNVDVACDKPGDHGTKDSTVFNIANASWTQSGVGFTKESARVTVNLDCAGYDPKGNPFTDIGSSAFKTEITWLYNAGITSGCTPTTFCPTASVTREQMASFLVRALDLPGTGSDFFTDDEASIHEGDINRLAAAGITGGCAAGKFCPGARVTREQMASFLARALDLPATATDFFNDDETSGHEGDINRLAKSGITGGCAAGKFCPGAHVTREQMAAFLYRALA